MIKRGYLPIHGAMVNIEMKNGKHANVVIMGDSGAGKSESLEALRALGENQISGMITIFDDMGIFKEKDGNIYGYGTEIGAFVRLDDLDQGYAFKELDRSIFMNPDKINARLVMPVAPYSEIIKGYKVDLFLYATTEKGLVESYFANPFGPVQKQKETDILIDKYFETLYSAGVKVGQIKTCLGVRGQEKNGPKDAALELFDIIKSIK